MPKKTESKLKKAMAAAIITKQKNESITETGYYDEKDLLKHYIRKFYWKKRIEVLRRDNTSLAEGIRYFTFCSKFAYDIRYFTKNNLIDFKSKVPSFTFVEFLKDDYQFLNEQFLPRHHNAEGFYGSLAEIATSSSHKEYGKFWSLFPYDVINLDYLGDILKTNSDKIGENDFYAIQSIIFKQSLLRRPYELWVTMRAKQGRFENVVKREFRKLIKHNIDNYQSTFGAKFSSFYGDNLNVDTLEDENLFLIGYIKWLWYVCKECYSVINNKKLQVIKYKRKDKDGDEYFLYNLFLRIEPFETISIPSPAGDAAVHCETEYKKGIVKSFIEPTDITSEFDNLSAQDKLTLEKEMKFLHEQYLEDEKGYIK